MGKLYLIRHAESHYNQAAKEWKALGKAMVDAHFQWDETYMDAVLNSIGIQQSRDIIPHVHSLDIHEVYVSPLRRALHTCDIIFKDHPNQPKIIVHPFLHERFHNAHDVSWYSGEPFPEFAHFDWSIVSQGPYFVNALVENEYSRLINGLDLEETRRRMLEIMQKINPLIFESNIEAFHRTQKAKKVWEDLTIDKNVALVGHSGNFRFMTSTLQEDGSLIEGIQLNNCEIRENPFN